MLDADYVFERLLREAANLVSKMSTPKLTAALKGASTLQQKITETLAIRLQEENLEYHCETSADTNLQQIISGTSLLSDVPLVTHTITQDLQKDNSVPVSVINQSNNCSMDSISPSSTYQQTSSVLLPSLPTLNLMANNNNTELEASNAILMPVMPQNSSTATMYRSPVSVPPQPAISHLTAVDSGEDHLNDHTVTSDSSVNFLDATIPGSPPLPITTLDCNGGQDHLHTSEQLNGELQTTELSLGMKPEPIDCIPRTSFDSLQSSSQTAIIAECPGIVSLPFAQLPSLGQFTSNPILKNALPNAHFTSINDGNPPSSNSFISQGTTNTTTHPTKAAAHGPGPYRCLDCDKEFRILRYLEKHRRIHTGEKPYQCCYCGRQFNDWPNMNRHKRIHTGERPYRCTVCNKTFSQPAVYNEHVKRHTGERPYICVVCTKGFPRAARLAVHMRVHTGERPYPCTSCDRRFSQPHHLAAHLRVHSGDRPYQCAQCEVSFACISNLRRHRKQVHPSSTGTIDEPVTDRNVNFTDKKPSAHRVAIISTHDPVPSSGSETALHVSTSALGADTSAALAAAMSGTILTATGALVPANLLPASSLPGIILTSAPPGAILAAPTQFADQQNQLQQTVIAHSSNLLDVSAPGLLSVIPNSNPITCLSSDTLTKAVSSSSTLSFMLPTVLTTNQRSDSLRQTAVTFLAPTGEPDRSCAGLQGATLMSTGQDGSIVVNSASGEAIYLEPLDARLAFETGQPFTLATIPTSHSQTATILGQSPSGTQLFGHPFQLQPGSHFAFATTGLPGQPPQIIGPSSSIISTTQASATCYTGHTPTILVPQPTVLSSGGSPGLSSLPMNPPTQATTPTQILHYPRCSSNSSNVSISPGRPSSTPVQQQQRTLFLPLVTSVVSPDVTTITVSDAGADWSTTGFTTTLVATSVSPNAATVEDNVESVSFVTSRPSSVLSSTSLNAASAPTTVGAVSDNII